MGDRERMRETGEEQRRIEADAVLDGTKPEGKAAAAGETEHKEENTDALKSGIETVIYGFVFLLLDFRIGRFNVLPDWLGYLLLRESVDELGSHEPDIVLLKPLAALLAAYDAINWVLALFGTGGWIMAVEVVITVVSIYFFYQFYTDLGNLAVRYGAPRAAWFYWLRVVQAAMTTFLMLFYYPLLKRRMAGQGWFAVSWMVASLVLCVCTALAVYALNRTIKERAQEV